jgi:hypothetical protein
LPESKKPVNAGAWEKYERNEDASAQSSSVPPVPSDIAPLLPAALPRDCIQDILQVGLSEEKFFQDRISCEKERFMLLLMVSPRCPLNARIRGGSNANAARVLSQVTGHLVKGLQGATFLEALLIDHPSEHPDSLRKLRICHTAPPRNTAHASSQQLDISQVHANNLWSIRTTSWR